MDPFAGEIIPLPPEKKSTFFGGKLFAVLSSCLLTFVVTYLFMMNTEEFSSAFEKNTSASIGIENDLNGFNNNKSEEIIESQYFSDEAKESEKKVKNYQNGFMNYLSEDGTVFENSVNKTSIQEYNSDLDKINEFTLINESETDKLDFSNITDDINVQNSYKEFNFESTKYDTIFFIRSIDSKFRFEFKNTPSWFFNQPKLQPYEISKFNNLQISLFYPVSRGLLLGVDFRQETYYVEYDGYNSKGQLATVLQHPNFSTFSLSLRYNPFDISKKIKAFGQLTFGANTYGPIAREMVGIEYYPFENVYILLSSELNQMHFKHEQNWYDANKFSINYGLGIKF
jgi:hypothetical protein